MKRDRLTVAALAVVLVGVLLVAGVGHQRAEVAAATSSHGKQVPQAATTSGGHAGEHESGDNGSASTAGTTRRTKTTPTPTTTSGAS